MTILFNKLASLELSEAIDFYEIQFKGLGANFKKEVKSAILRLKEFPTLCPTIKGDIRRYQLHKILYSVEENHIYIITES